MASDATVDAYDELLERYERISNIQSAAGVLSWDQEVMMPDGGTPARSAQRSALSATSHELLVEEDMEGALEAAESADLSGEQAAVVREIRRQYDRAARVPTDLVAEISQTTSEALPVWKEAKAEDDFETFAPILEDLLDLKREYADHIDSSRPPYEVLFEDYEPYLGLDTAERILDRLREELVPLIDEVGESDVEIARPFDGTFDADAQEALARDALDTLGYDWERGRLDTAPHPFSTGTQFDARVTTRFDEEDPLGALTSTIHEFGHATYTLGLPDDEYGSPLGESRNLSVHESQSRLWENHVGRSQPFWSLFLPKVKERFSGLDDVTARDAYEAANRVYDDNLIRVEADELTYHMHIVLRFEIERALIEGDLDVREVPQVWNDKMDEYLGIRPETDADGCLQDIHWSHGSFGYFPTYSLGSVLAAQLYESADAAIDDLDDDIESGEFDALHDWLTTNVHSHGQRYTTPDLIEEATGEAFTADYFLDHATAKYGALYDL
ncbi:carboxypeptidase M32 [Halococcus saccharolyticus]|uniref:Metal-dependent carboxypeptidase n=1 Tax=Halococcus saccharolyticus DSM 5350 TaxID=1227455 RepID=M0MJG7_9EURY|nr:carboxypeptidase M32 [Halococcus saccharolyticus]EMA45852.1 carboxypeptidase Taq [Halococcus saccharolyticus DSM 5350]